MKLISIQIFSNNTFGWESEKLIFGNSITQIYGPTGCGKTPLVQSIVYCLGYPVVFRNQIYENCRNAILEVDIADEKYFITRKYLKGRDFHVSVKGSREITQEFYNEREFSQHLFDLFSLSYRKLTGTDKSQSYPYLGTMLPIFYLEQDFGYTEIYRPPANFIKDQFSEMTRILFSLPAKNPFDEKKLLIDIKARLDFLDDVVHKQARELQVAQDDLADINRSAIEIRKEIGIYEDELNVLKNNDNHFGEAISVFDSLISSAKSELRNIDSEILEIEKRNHGIDQIISEIDTEIETLNINEEAKRIILSFNEICSSSSCQLFSFSSESYSKNLLYLKDQIKDLNRNSMLDLSRKNLLESNSKIIRESISRLENEKNVSLKNDDLSSIVLATLEIKDKIFILLSDLERLENVERIKKRNFESILKRDKVLDEYESIKKKKENIPEMVKIRSDFKDFFISWLEVLGTKNIRKDISFVGDLVPILGDEKISQLTGSTKTKAVLAYHAAILNLLAKNEVKNFNFIILDTPKQHEIEMEDFKNFITSLKDFSMKSSFQIIFSTTEYRHSVDGYDEEWVPNFDGEKQKMFFRDVL